MSPCSSPPSEGYGGDVLVGACLLDAAPVGFGRRLRGVDFRGYIITVAAALADDDGVIALAEQEVGDFLKQSYHFLSV